MKILITGGARSGKSRLAQSLAEQLAPRRTYLATARALDGEMADRIRRHRAERDGSWTTVEEPLNIAPLLDGEGVVLVDCLTLWVTNLMMERGPGADLSADFEALAEAVQAARRPVVLVTNEVGLGIVPVAAMAREFRDQAGWLAQRVAAICDGVALCVAGLPLWLSGGAPR